MEGEVVKVAGTHPFPSAPGVALSAETAAQTAPSESAVERLVKQQQEQAAQRARGRTEMVPYGASVADVLKQVSGSALHLRSAGVPWPGALSLFDMLIRPALSSAPCVLSHVFL